jgi:alkylhydroperoxidase family enzyme
VSGQPAQCADVAQLRALLAPSAGDRPRIAPAAPPELAPLARILSEIAGRVIPSGTPHILTTLGRHPRLFRAWLRYSAHLMPFGQLPRGDTELVILRVAWRCRSAYEWQQHVPIALRVGLTPHQVAGIATGPGSDAFTRRQRTLLAVSDELLSQRRLSDATWDAARAIFTDRDVIELCLLVGHYLGLASAIGGLGIEIERSADVGVVPTESRDDHSPMAGGGPVRTVTDKPPEEPACPPPTS